MAGQCHHAFALKLESTKPAYTKRASSMNTSSLTYSASVAKPVVVLGGLHVQCVHICSPLHLALLPSNALHVCVIWAQLITSRAAWP